MFPLEKVKLHLTLLMPHYISLFVEEFQVSITQLVSSAEHVIFLVNDLTLFFFDTFSFPNYK